MQMDLDSIPYEKINALFVEKSKLQFLDKNIMLTKNCALLLFCKE